MNFAWMRRLWQRIRGSDSGSKNPLRWFIDWIHGGQATDSGITLDGTTALRYAPVWYALNKICGHVGQLPLVLFERQGERRKTRARQHPAFRLMKKRPNRLMTASTFKELLTYHTLMWGNGRAAIVRNERADPVELIPLLPDRTKTMLVNGEKWHRVEVVTDEESQRREVRWLRDADVLHLVGLGFDGLVGYPLYELAKNSWGLGLACEKYGNRHFRQYAVPGLLLEAPQGVLRDDIEAKKFLTEFRAMHEGLDNAAKTALLREGIKASKLAHTGDESQFTETRQFQRVEAALWFLLEQILGDDASSSYNTMEQKNLAYLSNCLNRWLLKWEEECDDKLLREREKRADTHYFKFITAALLRSDTKTTYETLGIGITHRILSVNDARDILDLDEVAGGDERANPAITPGTPGTAGADPPANELLERVIASRFRDLIGVETNRVEAAAAKPARFIAWLDEFYMACERWPATLARALRTYLDAGAAAEAATAYCCASHAQLLDLAGQAAAEDLAGRAADLVAGWGDRADDLAKLCISAEALKEKESV